MSLPVAPLGRNGPLVPRLGLGLMGMSVFYGTVKPDSERLALLDQAHALGETFWDSADVYGDNEELLRKWFAANPEKRKDIFFVSKFANRVASNNDQTVDSTPEYCKEACEASLKRLGIEQIDLFYCHRLDKKTPIEKTIRAMVELKNEDKIRYLGLSECSAASLRRAHAVHPISAVQMEYSLFALEVESEQTKLLQTCRELGVAMVCYGPTGRGIISGKFRSPEDFEPHDFRRVMPRWTKENFPKNLHIVDEMGKLAEKKGCTPTQLALAWLMAQGDDIFPIPGTTNPDRLQENLGSCSVVLSAEEEKQIRKLCEEAEIAGERFADVFMEYCFADTPEEE